MHRWALVAKSGSPYGTVTVRLLVRPSSHHAQTRAAHHPSTNAIIIFDRKRINMAIHFPHVHLRLGFLGMYVVDESRLLAERWAIGVVLNGISGLTL
jgi:hypothetical protein